MNELFLKIVNMSIAASWLVLAVLLLRLFLKKAPKWVNVLLWGIVAVRLICPFSLQSPLSLIPSAETIPLDFEMEKTPEIDSGIGVLDGALNPIVIGANTPIGGASVNPLQIVVGVLWNVWIVGMILLLGYMAFSYWRIRLRMKTAVLYGDNIYQSDAVSSPFVLGVIRPRIYLPFSLDKRNIEYVIAHEQTHIRRKDHLWKPIGFLLLTLHWFNPLMWLAYVLLCRDIELACDEKVIQALGYQERADYMQALVDCSVNRRKISVCPLAFGEVGVKERVRSVMLYKKPAFWLVILALTACVVTALCFLTDPITVRNEWVKEYIVGAEGIVGQVDKEKYESVSEDFAIGADKYGRAVFKEPRKAFDTMKRLYGDALALIASQEDLAPISQSNYNMYKKYGWQVTGVSEEEKKRAAFVSSFLDIYENSFTKDTPYADAIPPTVAEHSIADLFEEIESSPAISSNPQDYINANAEAYNQLVALGEDTLVFIFSEFLKGGQTGLHGHILYRVMADILTDNQLIAYDALNGQEYFDHWLESARSLQRQHDDAWLEENLPAAALVLRMAEKKEGLASLLTLTEVSRDRLDEIDAYKFIQDNLYARYLLIQTKEPLSNVRVTSMALEETGMMIGDVLYTLPSMNAQKPLLLGLVFPGDLTTYGLLFTDAQGREYGYRISVSGRDGSLILQPHSDAESVDDADPALDFAALITEWEVWEKDERYLGSITVNPIEFVLSTDQERIRELDLSFQDTINGYYIHDEEKTSTVLKIPKGTLFVFYDWTDLFNDPTDSRYGRVDRNDRWVGTKDLSVFAEYLATYKQNIPPFTFVTNGDMLTFREIFVM